MLLLYAARLFRQCRNRQTLHDLTSVLVQFVSLCVICRIYSYLCICAVYIRGTCSLSGGMCGLQHTERIHTAKQNARDPFVSRLALKEFRVRFVFMRRKRARPPRSMRGTAALFAPWAAFERSFPPAGRCACPHSAPRRQRPLHLCPGVAGPSAALWACRRAAGSVVQPVYSWPPVHRTIYTKAGFGRAHGSDAAIVL